MLGNVIHVISTGRVVILVIQRMVPKNLCLITEYRMEMVLGMEHE
jgi:hypothetical protein